MVSREESSMPLLKPIACTYNPSPGSLPICHELPGFSFMKSERSGDIFARASSSIEVDPISLGIPWPTSFPLARQCKHWITAIQSGKDLLEELYYLSSADEKKLPQGLFTGSDPICLSKRGNAAVENAVNAAIYMNPEASQTKILLIVKAYLLLWLLGDIVEVIPERAGFTAMDIAIAECPEIAQRHAILPTNTSSFASDLINEDPILGLEFFKSIVDWSYTMRKKPQNTFSGLRDFLNCRSIDVADDMLWRCARFSSGARLSQAEEEAMRPFERLVMDHIVFTNDIYSFDKEKEDFLSKGATFLNTVHYLEQALSVRSETAKSIAFHLVSEVEIKLEQELIGLKESSLFGQEQVKYAHALIEMAAGNVFYSATSARYGRKSAIPFHSTE